MSAIKERLVSDVKVAMKAKDKDLVGTLRLITSAVKQVEVDTRTELTDIDVLGILTKMVKQRQDSLTIFANANRKDLADKEQYELNVISRYLPKQMTEAEIVDLVAEKIIELDVKSAKDMGRLMAALKPLVAGKADMSIVSKIVKQKI